MRSFYTSTALITCLIAAPALAEIKLESIEGGVEISGEFIELTDGVYVIETTLGTLRLDADMVNCSGDECPQLDTGPQTLRISASEAFLPELLPNLMNKLADQNGNGFQLAGQSELMQEGMIVAPDKKILANFENNEADADDAFAALLNGDVDMILTERRATNAEIEQFLAAGLGNLTSANQEVIFGQDAVAIIVSPDNPVDALSVDQIEAIFSGQISNWSEVGGIDAPISLFAPEQDSSISKYFTEAVLDRNFSTFASEVDQTNGTSGIDAKVIADPAAIGLTSSANVDGARIVPLASSCGILTSALDFNIRSEDYPMSRRLFAYTTNRDLPSQLTQLKDLMQNTTGQSIVAESGFNSLTTQEVSLDNFGQRLAYALSSPTQASELQNLRKFSGEVLNARRLSTTFRFATGSSQLDNKSRADVERLATLLQTPQYSDAEVLLVGFTDSIGKSDVNTLLSQRRAGQVLDEMSAFVGTDIDLSAFTVFGYGASNPVACNTDDTGRDLNRRVEVWVR